MTEIERADIPEAHDLPLTSSDQRMHDLSPECWCGPTQSSTVPGLAERYIHKAPEDDPASDPRPPTMED